MKRLAIEAALVKELFDYKDGALYWLTQRNYGKRAGTIHSTKRRHIYIAGKIYKEHRLIFLWHHGYMPDEVDHIDGDSLNNRIENLRAASHSQNNMNKKRRIDNTSGEKGVSWAGTLQKWVIYCFVDGKKLYGTPACTNDYDLAVQSARALREKYHGAFAKHN